MGCRVQLHQGALAPQQEAGADEASHEESVIILVDGRRAARLNIGQLADYITMVGLAQIRADANTGTAPTILKVFDSPEAPAGLSAWDESFLRGLYTTKQSSIMQTSSIKTSMFQQLKR
jgi:hypothetical protein